MFKVLAREDGYQMLVVGSDMGSLRVSGQRDIPLSRYIISVLADSGLTLADLAAGLDEVETQRRAHLMETTESPALSRAGRARPGFGNADPWYDGRALVLANTIVDSPRQGSVLKLDDVVSLLDRLYGGSVRNEIGS